MKILNILPFAVSTILLSPMVNASNFVPSEEFATSEKYLKQLTTKTGVLLMGGCPTASKCQQTRKEFEEFCRKVPTDEFCVPVAFMHDKTVNEFALNPNDGKKAIELFKLACEGFSGGGACFFLGNKYTEGKIVEKSEEEAAKYYGAACSKKIVKGCRGAMESYYSLTLNRDQKYAKETFHFGDLACSYSDVDVCLAMGDFYSRGFGGSRNLKNAKEYYQKACDFGYQAGCNRLKEIEISQ